MATDNTDFEAAFAQFSAPDDKAKSEPPADAAPAGEGDQGAAEGGDDGGAATGAGDAPGDGAAGADGAGGDGAAGDEGAADGGAEGAAGDEGAAEGAEGSGDKGEGKGADAGAPDPAAAQPSADDILAGLKKLVSEAKPEAKAEEKTEPKADEKPVYSDDEQAFLAEYDKEWPDVARGEALKRRAEYQQLLGYVFEQVVNYVKPFVDMTEALAHRTHHQDITTAVPEYSDNLREEVTEWVKTQPAYLQDAYNHVITEGTVDEVKDLVDRFRAATGRKSAGAGEPKPNGKKDNELSDEAKQAAASLAPVESKRSGVREPSDPSNFDDAWKQFAADSV